MKKILLVSSLALSLAAAMNTHASGGASGAKVGYNAQGKIGAVLVNPYGIAPLTAVIQNGGRVLDEATVRIVPKKNGQEIKYKVSKQNLMTHGGIPVFGLYADYVNTVEVTYVISNNGKKEKVSESYRIYAPAIYTIPTGNPGQKNGMFKTTVNKVDKKYSDRLYLLSNFLQNPPMAGSVVWNNPQGGSLEWGSGPAVGIIDTAGEVRWYLNADKIWNPREIYKSGAMMGFEQNSDGTITWGFGQRYVKYDLLGREIFNRELPKNYVDFSHAMDAAQNGHYFLRVGSSDFRRSDNKRVRTVRDVIVEVDGNGKVIDEWRLWEILDAYRDPVLKSMDQGAVCLNIDVSKAGTTMSEEELAQMDKSETFGDITGVGPGRNWAHVNSIDYDPSDDSIILSVRNQSAIVKIGRDKKVKWIIASPEGWRKDLLSKVLKPVDSSGKTIKCENNACEKGFDWTWTQHSAFRADAKSDSRYVYVTVFDNGDGRGMDQPPLPTMKYSRGVVYKVDQKKMTVEQVWDYSRGQDNDWYSPITSTAVYNADKNSVLLYSASAGLLNKPLQEKGKPAAPRSVNPWLQEFDWGKTEPSVEIRIHDSLGYQATPVDLKKAFQ